MRFLLLLAFELVVLFAFAPREVASQIGPPTMWELRQNDPNPFCSDPGATRIDFQVPQSALVTLQVLSSDGSQIVRTLHNGMLNPGFFTVVWDGRDATNVPVPEGTYPYQMTAIDLQLIVLFLDTKTATVECLVGVQPDPWGVVKQLYR